MNRIGRCLAVVGALIVIGLTTWPLEESAWEQVRSEMPPTLQLEELEPALGQGILIALLGGFRAVIADFMFIRGYTYWEKRDAARTEAMFRLASEIEPSVLYFWLNRSRMVGYDFAIWRIDQRGGFSVVPEFVQEELKQEEAIRALAILDRAEFFHPERFEIPLARARLYLNRLQDREQAAYWFGVASRMAGAPKFTQRLHAQMLYELGRVEEAYYFLREIFPDLSKNDLSAARMTVLERIRMLEDELNLSYAQRLPVQAEEVY